MIAKAKGYEELSSVVNEWTGEEEFAAIVKAIESRNGRIPTLSTLNAPLSVDSGLAASTITSASPGADSDAENTFDGTIKIEETVKTPVCSHSPDPTILRAPLMPSNESRMPIPAFVSGQDVPTPTPIPVPSSMPTPPDAVDSPTQ